jgi:hypothetical protein
MSDHLHHEELAALLAGGHLCDEELSELRRHAESCAQCKTAIQEFGELVHFGLPLTQSRLRRSINMITNRPDPGATERFIRRASHEGIAFSQNVIRPDRTRISNLSFVASGAAVLAAVIIAFLYGSHHSIYKSLQPGQQSSTQAQPQLEHLIQHDSTLDATISRLENTLAAQKRESEGLHAQVTTLSAAANNLHHDNEKTQVEASQSASRSARSLEEAEAQLKIQEKMLTDTRAELARLNQARASEQASLVADQVQINELADQLKTAKANIDMEHQLAAAGRDVRDLMGARQLHVVDVRDTDPNGKAGKAFGRVFLTEGKSLIFYAFDLNDARKADAKQTFQVWGQQEGKASSLRSLGFLYVDDKAQRRWALKTEDPAVVKEIDSVFVTVEPQGGAKKPSGQHLLYAYLGEANHP